MLKLKNMDGTITIRGREVPFSFNHAEGSLSFGDMESSQAMDLLNTLAGSAPATTKSIGSKLTEAPTLPARPKTAPPVETAPVEVQAKVANHEATIATEDAPAKPEKRKRVRRTKAQIAADKAATAPEESAPMVAASVVDAGDMDDPPQSSGVGTATAPRAAVPEPDEAEKEPGDGPAFTVVDLSDDSVPDGWAKDAKGRLYCLTCGEVECSCDSDAAADAEFDDAIEKTAAKKAAAPAPEITEGSNAQPSAEEIDDPIFDLCSKETRLIPMMDIMVANGIETVDAIYEKCMQWRNAAPALLKIKPDVLDSRLRRAISSVVP